MGSVQTNVGGGGGLVNALLYFCGCYMASGVGDLAIVVLVLLLIRLGLFENKYYKMTVIFIS